ncbi:unnamed protein product [Lactuca virosa]|uniref:GATA-type domain-containing protein n=1 Tax=Lactuca virosa TaxID=75947 RepID=A0AAU9MC09_9ASTR|nr:unnamed protein product [Lactuca virosa]
MVKEGPCYHCGIEETPLWRNGPAEKPVLCNACGSRWRTRRTLNDYIPKHAMKELQGTETDEDSDYDPASGSSSTKPTTHDPNPSQLPFENALKRKRTNFDQHALTPVEQFSKQLLDIAHEQPEVYLKKPRDGDVLIDRADVAKSTTLETDLGAVILVPQHETPSNFESVETTKTKISSDVVGDVAGSSGDQGEPK